MPRAGITLEDVKKAVEMLERNGESVTQSNVRRALGDTGSMTTIKTYLEEIRKQKSNAVQNLREMPSDLEKQISTMISEIWSKSLEYTQQDINEIRQAANAKVSALQAELDDLCKAYDEQSEKLRALENALKNERDNLKVSEKNMDKIEAEKIAIEKMYQQLLQHFDAQAKEFERMFAQIDIRSDTDTESQNKSRIKKPCE